MCGANRLTLTEHKRSDAKLFGFYTSLQSGTADAHDLQVALREAKRLFPEQVGEASMSRKRKRADVQDLNEFPGFTLTMSHQRRVQINRQTKTTSEAAGFDVHPISCKHNGRQPRAEYVGMAGTATDRRRRQKSQRGFLHSGGGDGRRPDVGNGPAYVASGSCKESTIALRSDIRSLSRPNPSWQTAVGD